MRTRALRLAVVAATALALGAGCTGPFPGPRSAPAASFRMASLENVGDPARRASNRLLAAGLDRDVQGKPSLALGQYERALQVDPTNPYAYLVLARHHVEANDAERSLSFLDRAEALFAQEPQAPPGVEAHLVGLRGVALRGAGRSEAARPLLARARELDPAAWSDGRLSARELR